jgi:hypothetical protein
MTNISYRDENFDCFKICKRSQIRGTLYPQQLALSSPTSGCRLVGIVRSRTQATDCFVLFFTNSDSVVRKADIFPVCELRKLSVFKILAYKARQSISPFAKPLKPTTDFYSLRR